MSNDMFAQLARPFPAQAVSWRVGSKKADGTKGLALAYLDARDVMDRLDTVVGPANWQDRYEFHGPRTVCYLSIRVDGEWITKADGAGDSDVEAEKGAISDALKRAAVKFGIGRYLYSLPQVWVELEAVGRSHRIKDSEHRKLEALLGQNAGQPQKAPEKAPSAYQAKKDGVGPRADEMIHEVRTLESKGAVDQWVKTYAQEIAGFPENWQTMIKDEVAEQRKWLAEKSEQPA